MCTVTIIRTADDGLRMVASRDESPVRSPAVPPEVRVIDGVRVLFPRDPQSGGTWVAANDRGLVMTVLNFNLRPAHETPSGRVSRGRVILEAASASDVEAVMACASELELDAMSPFRLVVAQGDTVLEGRWDGNNFEIRRHALTLGAEGASGSACFASSGLGDALVLPRLELWSKWSNERDITGALQDAFHAHQWPERPEISVKMKRDGAETVSVTTVDVRPGDSIDMRYCADELCTASRLALRATAAVSVPMHGPLAEATV